MQNGIKLFLKSPLYIFNTYIYSPSISRDIRRIQQIFDRIPGIIQAGIFWCEYLKFLYCLNVFDFENREELKNILWKMWKHRNTMWLQKDFDLIVRSASWDLM